MTLEFYIIAGLLALIVLILQSINERLGGHLKDNRIFTEGIMGNVYEIQRELKRLQDPLHSIESNLYDVGWLAKREAEALRRQDRNV